MTGKKLDFLTFVEGHPSAVKVRILENSGRVFASFDCGRLHGWNAPIEELDEMMEMLASVRAEVLKGAYAEPD